MKKFFTIFILTLIIVPSFLYLKNNFNQNPVLEDKLETSNEDTYVNIQAKFRIITNGTTRVFADKKYHSRSSDVYIDPENPTLVVVKKKGIIWSDFFKTLPAPMKLEKDCLTTGTGQTFCTNEKQKLVFKLNEIGNSNALDEEIKDLDFLLIEYK